MKDPSDALFRRGCVFIKEMNNEDESCFHVDRPPVNAYIVYVLTNYSE